MVGICNKVASNIAEAGSYAARGERVTGGIHRSTGGEASRDPQKSGDSAIWEVGNVGSTAG